MFHAMHIQVVDQHTDIDALLRSMHGQKLYLLVARVICTKAMLLRNILFASFSDERRCFVSGFDMIFAKPEHFTGRNLLLEHLATWWVERKPDEMPPDTLISCPITHDAMERVYLLSDGTSYGPSIFPWIRDNATSPLTRKYLYIAKSNAAYVYSDGVARYVLAFIRRATECPKERPTVCDEERPVKKQRRRLREGPGF